MRRTKFGVRRLCAGGLAGFVLVLLPILWAGQAAAETMVERGKYLVEGIGGCGNCHTPRGGPMKGRELVGGNSFGDQHGPFLSYSANITPHRETGIGNWTDAQIIAAIREGRRPDGSVIGPPMAIEFYHHMSDRDVKAIVAYLSTVKPVRNVVKKSTYHMPLHAAPPLAVVPDVPATDKLRYGEYLVTIGHCMECHTPLVRGQPDLENKLGAGGRTFPGPWGESVSANITQDKETGIGSWTDAQIKRAMTKGIRHDGTRLRPPMCFDCYAKMTDADLDAVVAYLRTVKPIRNEVR